MQSPLAVFVKTKENKKRGFTLLEAVLGVLCVSIIIVAVFSSVSLAKATELTANREVKFDNYVMIVADAISEDLNDGIDITGVVYDADPRLNNTEYNIGHTIEIQKTDFDVFGKPIYRVDIHLTANAKQRTASLYLREKVGE